jgi:hypothetical protein
MSSRVDTLSLQIAMAIPRRAFLRDNGGLPHEGAAAGALIAAFSVQLSAREKRLSKLTADR